jgi:hypothetical protein
VLPVDPYTDGRIRCWAKHSDASAEGTGSHGLHHTQVAVPRFPSTAIHPLLPQPPPSTQSSIPSRCGTPVPNRDPLKPPLEPPTEPAAPATTALAALPEPWRVGSKDAEFLIPAVEATLASGWTLENFIPHISQNPGGIRSPARVLARRLADLPHPPRRSLPPTIAWCGQCEDERSRTITIAMPDGTEAAAFCPRCSPQARRKHMTYPYLKEVN